MKPDARAAAELAGDSERLGGRPAAEGGDVPFIVDPPEGFDTPTHQPASAEQARAWQRANRAWWERHPMRYDWKDPLAFPEFSREFFDEIDRRFLENAREFMPWSRLPFEELIPYDALPGMDVLEVGVGNGTHAELLARRARSFTGIDLTEYAVNSTTRRMRVRGIDDATVRRMDAERLEFPDASFDFVWSWGVIHCASDTARVLSEIRRVLRPGGRSVLMVYHRSAWQYYVLAGLFHGVLRGDLLRSRSLARTLQRQSDGAFARYYTRAEWEALVAASGLRVLETRVYGSKAELVPLPGGAVKRALMSLLPDALTRYFTNTLGWGRFLTTIQERPR